MRRKTEFGKKKEAKCLKLFFGEGFVGFPMFLSFSLLCVISDV